MPLSRACGILVNGRKWYRTDTYKGPHLAGGSGKTGDTAKQKHDEEQAHHDRRASQRACCSVEQLVMLLARHLVRYAKGRLTSMKGYPVAESSAVSGSPSIIMKVMIMTKPMPPLTYAVHIIALGRLREASLSSSAMYVAASGPTKEKTGDRIPTRHAAP